MNTRPLSPRNAFFVVSAAVLLYHLLWAVGGKYLTMAGALPHIAGYLMLVWVPVVGGVTLFAWTTRGAPPPLLWRTVQAVIAAILSTAVSFSAMYFLVVLTGEE